MLDACFARLAQQNHVYAWECIGWVSTCLVNLCSMMFAHLLWMQSIARSLRRPSSSCARRRQRLLGFVIDEIHGVCIECMMATHVSESGAYACWVSHSMIWQRRGFVLSARHWAEASSSSSGLSPAERMATIRGVNQLADVLKEAIKRKWNRHGRPWKAMEGHGRPYTLKCGHWPCKQFYYSKTNMTTAWAIQTWIHGLRQEIKFRHPKAWMRWPEHPASLRGRWSQQQQNGGAWGENFGI